MLLPEYGKRASSVGVVARTYGEIPRRVLWLLSLCVCGYAQTWTSLGGPFNDGIASSIAVDRTDKNHWLVGFAWSGLWETTDGGANLSPLSDSWPTLAVGAVAFAPSNPKVIYVGTGDSDDVPREHAGMGLMKSTDGGKTWTLLGASSFAQGSFRRIRVDPANPNILLAATARGAFGRDGGPAPSPPPFGILRSVDGGVTWVRTLAGQATALDVNPADFSLQYAAIGDQRSWVNDTPGKQPNGLYRSTDGGKTWSPVAGPWGTSTLAAPATGRFELAVAPSNPNTLYASVQKPNTCCSTDAGLLGLFRTDDAGDPAPVWVRVPTDGIGSYGASYCDAGPPSNPIPQGGCGYAHSLTVDPTDPNTAYVAGQHYNLWRCRRCGASPDWVNQGLDSAKQGQNDHHVVEWAGDRLINGNDHGLYSTTDGGDSWQNHNSSLTTATFVSGDLHPTNPNIVFGEAQDANIVLVNSVGGRWQCCSGQTPFELGESQVVISTSHPDTDWMSSWGGAQLNNVGRTTDGGKTWISANAGLTPHFAGEWAAPYARFVKCPSNDDVLITGTDRMWRSNNFFSASLPTWAANGPADDSNAGQTGNPGTILGIAFAPSDNACNTYAYGTRGHGVRLTRDGGVTWTDLDPGKSLPGKPVNSLAFDPANPNVLYAALSSFDEATPGKPGHIFKAANALAAAPVWVNISPSADLPFNVIAIDALNSRHLFAGADAGLWFSADGGSGWTHMGPETGLPNAPVYDLKFNAVTKRGVAFTFGRGAYMLGGLGYAGPPPTPRITAAANGATYLSGGLVPGSWAQVTGTDLSDVTRIWSRDDFAGLGNALPTNLSGTQVTVNNVAAAVYYISPTQVDFQVPSSTLSGPSGYLLVSSPVTVQLIRNGIASNSLTVEGDSSAPAIFPVSLNGKNYPAAVFLDGKLAGDPAISPAFRNARPDEIVQLFVTGLNRQQSGILPTPQTYDGVKLKLGSVSFAADSATLVGVGEFQINFHVPHAFATMPEGDYPITVQIPLDNGVASSPETINSNPPGPVVIPIQH